MKKVLLLILIGLALIFFWLGSAGAFLSKCLVQTSIKYKDYPQQYAQGIITKQKFEETFLELKQENSNCQIQTKSKFLIPNFITQILTSIATKGKGLP